MELFGGFILWVDSLLGTSKKSVLENNEEIFYSVEELKTECRTDFNEAKSCLNQDGTSLSWDSLSLNLSRCSLSLRSPFLEQYQGGFCLHRFADLSAHQR